MTAKDEKTESGIKAPVAIVGLGMSPEDLTRKHLQIIEEADILVGGRRHLAYFENTPAIKKEITGDIKGAVSFIRDRIKDHRIVVLASGDPLFFGIAPLIVHEIGPDAVEILPNISSVAAAFARIKEPWSRTAIVSLHGRDHESELLGAVKRCDRVAVFTDPERNPAWLAAFLSAKGLLDFEMGVFEQLGGPEEKTGWYSLAAAAGRRFADPNMVVLKRLPDAEPFGRLHYIGLPDADLEHERGLITKTEIRAVALAKLRLLPHHTLWDLGAGSGSVAVEAALLLPRGRIVAVEKNAARVEHIKENARRYGIFNIDVIQAELPEGMDGLPAPDRVFVGGGGRRLGRIIKAAHAAMNPGGIMVVNTVLLANLTTALGAFQGLNCETDAVQVQVNATRSMPWSERFEAGNPVWIVSGKKGGKIR